MNEAPPHSLDAERAILAGVFLDESAVTTVANIVAPGDFYGRGNGIVFRTMLELHAAGSPIDTVTVRERIVASGELDRVGGDAHLLGLTSLVPPVANIETHATIVREKAALRRLADAGRAVQRAASAEDIDGAIASIADARRVVRSATAKRIPFAFVSSWGDDVIGEEPPRREYLLVTDDERAAGVLPLGRAGMLAAGGGVGKTMAVLQLALAVACGGRWLSRFRVAAPGHVLVALAEEDRAEVQRRLHWASRAMQLGEDARRLAADRIMAVPLTGHSVSLTETDAEGNTRETAFVETIRGVLGDAGVDWRLVVLDPLARFAGAEVEKDNAAATRFVEVIETLTQAPGRPTVLVAHHTNKMARREDGHGATAARGSSALTDGFRWQANLEELRDCPDVVRFHVTKSNYTKRGAPIFMVRESGGALRPLTVEELAERDLLPRDRGAA